MDGRKKAELPTEGFNLESLMETLFYRDEFLSIASHELKTPLTSMQLRVQMFKRAVKKNDQLAYSKAKVDQLVDQVDVQISQMLKLIDDMLDISRIRSGQFIMTKHQFNVGQMLQQVLHKDYKDELNQISCQMDSNIFIYGDGDRIGQVFNKLIKNSLKYG